MREEFRNLIVWRKLYILPFDHWSLTLKLFYPAGWVKYKLESVDKNKGDV